MRFLADMPISRSTTTHLQSKGHDAVHLLDLGLERADRPITISNLLDKNLSKTAPELEKGAIAIFEESRVRLLKLPL